MRKHLKRLRVPIFWNVPKKENKWVTRPRPGGHRLFESIPLLTVLRDVLKIADTAEEAKTIITSRKVLVDGRVRTDHKFAIGLMDVLSIPALKKSYRVMPSHKGLELVEVSAAEAAKKLYRVAGKTSAKSGKAQLRMHDGVSMLVDAAEAKKIALGDTLVIELGSKKMGDLLKLEKGAYIIITKGKNAGLAGKIEDIIATGTKEPDKIITKVGGEKLEVIKSYVLVVGKNEPVIKLAG
ncbi:MAG: 30S ribosomal protein S4e [Candidatus Aenigmarchaeota archaeon]|nr:30S ribosomal protein S4e [Candidatus Aenigmarchaeota archaeon]